MEGNGRVGIGTTDPVNALVYETKIIIPTCKPNAVIAPLVEEIRRTAVTVHRLITVSGPDCSAAQNRNAGLERQPDAEFVIMVDDDISGFERGWDLMLIHHLQRDPTVLLVSARLMRPGKQEPGPMMSSARDLSGPVEVVKKVPTACIAFRRTYVGFDENFLGSGFEDDDWLLRLAQERRPGGHAGGRIIIDNDVKVVHANEMKHQSEHWECNKAYFEKKWGRQHD